MQDYRGGKTQWADSRGLKTQIRDAELNRLFKNTSVKTSENSTLSVTSCGLSC